MGSDGFKKVVVIVVIFDYVLVFCVRVVRMVTVVVEYFCDQGFCVFLFMDSLS